MAIVWPSNDTPKDRMQILIKVCDVIPA